MTHTMPLYIVGNATGFDVARLGVKELLDEMLTTAAEEDVSDIIIASGRPVLFRKYGANYVATKAYVNEAIIAQIIRVMQGDSTISLLNAGNDTDFAYETVTNKKRWRFRVNMSSIDAVRSKGYAVSLRPIPTNVPTLDELEVPAEMRSALFAHSGLVLIMGPTGAGKTTLAASALLDRARASEHGEIIQSVEAPIEFRLHDKELGRSEIYQIEVPTHLPSFGAAVRNFMRRSPTFVNCGEVRDFDTLSGLAQFSLTGHPAISSGHGNGVAEGINRFLLLPPDNRQAFAADLASAMSSMITQLLIPNRAGTRTAIREYLIFTDEVKKELFKVDTSRWSTVLKGILNENKTSMYHSAVDAVNAGDIDETVLLRFEKRAAA